MSDVTRILQAIDRGDPQASSQLLPLVYQELVGPLMSLGGGEAKASEEMAS